MGESWQERSYDAALHLLDRQIVGSDGRLIGKVDDVELTVDPDGVLVVTGLLVGGAALLPRFGGRLGRWLAARYRHVAIARGDRSQPYVVDIALIDEVTSEVHVSAPREGLLQRRTPHPAEPERHRLGQLLGMDVRLPGSRARRVIDARLVPAERGRHRIAAVLVGRGRPGSLLGYERRGEQGPWLVAVVVRALHRHTRVVDLGAGVEIDWAARELRAGERARVSAADRRA